MRSFIVRLGVVRNTTVVKNAIRIIGLMKNQLMLAQKQQLSKQGIQLHRRENNNITMNDQWQKNYKVKQSK